MEAGIQALKEYEKSHAVVTNITCDKEKETITVTINARGSIFFDQPKPPYLWMGANGKTFVNSASIVDGFNLILKHGHHIINEVKNHEQFRLLEKENDRLRTKLNLITAFENGTKITLEGLTFQKAINEDSFYSCINNPL